MRWCNTYYNSDIVHFIELSVGIHTTMLWLLLLWLLMLQDPNWYKAKRADGLEGMIPANFVFARVDSDGPSEVVGSKQAVKLQEMPSVY